MYANAVYEMQGRLQAARVRELTNDAGVHDTLSFMLARDLLHQQQWLAVVEELGGPTEVLPVPAQVSADTLGDHAKVSYAVSREIDLPPAPAAVFDGLPGTESGPSMLPKQVANGAP